MIKMPFVKHDNIAIEILELIDILNSKKVLLEKQLQTGYFNLAKSRYSMGVNRISSLQYPQLMEAQLYVDCTDDQQTLDKVIKFKLKQKESVDDEFPTSDYEQVDAKNMSTLRLRKINADHVSMDQIKNKEVVYLNDRLGENDSTHNSMKTVTKSDPLTWFGILIPPTLRQAKSAFVEVLHLSCEICTIEKRLNACINSCGRLKADSEKGSCNLVTDDLIHCLKITDDIVTSVESSSPIENLGPSHHGNDLSSV